jgi:hypothetical protein
MGWRRDPKSEIRKKLMTGPGAGSKGQKRTGSQIRICNTSKNHKNFTGNDTCTGTYLKAGIPFAEFYKP